MNKGKVVQVVGPVVDVEFPDTLPGIYHALTVELTRTTEHWRLALGLAIVLLVLAFPQGLAGFLRSRFEKSA